MSASAIYEGTIRHRRFETRANEFEHKVTFAYVDLDELPRLLGGRLLRRGPGLVRLRRRDLLGGDAARPVPVADAVRALIADRTGAPAPTGPVRVLTHPRVLGTCFNPVSFYYCFSEAEELEAVVAEVTNTPWGERHAYVLRREGAGPVLGGEHDKALHVSPFMDMEQRYRWKVPAPGETLSVHIGNERPSGQKTFDATLSMQRKPFTRGVLNRMVARYPAGSLRFIALIYGHALGLKLKGVSVHPHPKAKTETKTTA
jgi:DUF1365 family protein